MRASNALPPLLFLCHRLPFPPDKGDKIRSYHLLRHFSVNYRVYLGTFIDDPADEAHVPRVNELCEDSCIIRIRPTIARIKSATGFLTGAPLSIPYYHHRKMKQWVRSITERVRFRHVLVFSSPMAQYASIPQLADSRIVVDFVDVDSEKWSQYAQRKPAPVAWIYNREAKRLAEFEHQTARRSSASIFVSEAEAALFRSRLMEPGVTVTAISNGVDTDFFRPDPTQATPFSPTERPIVFTGAMDYWANIDAVTWFTKEILSKLIQVEPSARFYIVGSKPADAVLQLAGTHTVVTGRVPDVRPYLEHAAVVVAPMRIARGIQNKVLEGMAMAKSVVTTPKGLEGIDAQPGKEVLVADSCDAFVEVLARLLNNSAADVGAAARRCVVEKYTWSESIGQFAAQLCR